MAEIPSEQPAPPVEPELPGIRLAHIIYLVSLLVASTGTFDVGGLTPFLIVAVFWGVVFTSRSRPRALLVLCCLLVLGGICTGPLLPAFSAAREPTWRMQCSNKLRQITLALYNYYDKHNCFPPAHVPDEDGQPKHSWRVLIRPFLEQQQLYNACHFDEPWDGPNNRALLSQRPVVYSCPSHAERIHGETTCTSYVAVVGRSAAWPGAACRKLSEFRDGTSNTVLILEAGNESIPWCMSSKKITFRDTREEGVVECSTPSDGYGVSRRGRCCS